MSALKCGVSKMDADFPPTFRSENRDGSEAFMRALTFARRICWAGERRQVCPELIITFE